MISVPPFLPGIHEKEWRVMKTLNLSNDKKDPVIRHDYSIVKGSECMNKPSFKRVKTTMGESDKQRGNFKLLLNLWNAEFDKLEAKI